MGDLATLAGVTILTPAEETILSVVTPQVLEVEEAAAEGEEAVAEGEEGAAAEAAEGGEGAAPSEAPAEGEGGGGEG